MIGRRGRRAGERGATAVEFALIMLPLFYIVFGIIQYGLYFYSMQTGTSAVSDAVRRLSVGDCQANPDLKAYVQARLGAANAGNLSVPQPAYFKPDGTALGATDTVVVGDGVQLTVTYDAPNMHFPFVPLPHDGQVIRTVFARVEDTVASTGGCQA